MKIAVLNGSPKGEISVTVQYIRYLQKKFPEHEFKLFHIAHDILKLEKKGEAFQQIIDEVKSADGVMWAFPLYTLLVASQYKRFIEMIWEKGVQEAFREKYACALSTSVHFFDNTAHNYIRDICDDLGMKFIESYSSDMDELFSENRRDNFLRWAGAFQKAIKDRVVTVRTCPPVVADTFTYQPGKATEKITADGLKIRVVADILERDSNIARMVERFASALAGDVRVFDVGEMGLTGGCLGCLECAFDNRCVYKDGFVDFYNQELRGADVTIYAGPIRDRYFSARMKMFRDRSFFNGHIPVNLQKQVGYIVSGPLGQLPNLQEVLQGGAEMSGGNLVGMISDESADSKVIDALLDAFAVKCVDYAKSQYMRPQTFLGVGGHKIFRDQIWARLRFPFDADFKFYSEHDMFDFPQNDSRYLEFSQQMLAAIQDPQMKEAVRKAIKTEMLRGYKKAVEEK